MIKKKERGTQLQIRRDKESSQLLNKKKSKYTSRWPCLSRFKAEMWTLPWRRSDGDGQLFFAPVVQCTHVQPVRRTVAAGLGRRCWSSPARRRVLTFYNRAAGVTCRQPGSGQSIIYCAALILPNFRLRHSRREPPWTYNVLLIKTL